MNILSSGTINWVLLLFAPMLWVYKFYYKKQYVARHHKQVSHRWILWFTENDIDGTSSETRRQFMKRSNLFTNIIVAILVVTGLLFFFNR